VVDIEVEDEGEVEAAELLLKTFYSTVDAGKPLRGASQATLLQVCFDRGARTARLFCK
jgi:hypothetical protein